MFEKKKLINDFWAALILSLCILCSLAQVFVDFDKAAVTDNIIISVVFILIFGMNLVIAFILKNRRILAFSAVLEGVSAISWIAVTLISAEFAPLDLLTFLLSYPLLGFGLLSEYGEVVMVVLYTLLSVASFVLFRLAEKK